jgi:hypothetical protein
MADTKIEELARRVETEAPSGELDAEIQVRIYEDPTYRLGQSVVSRKCNTWWEACSRFRWDGFGGHRPWPAYTTSIDAALSLVPEGWLLRQMNLSAPCADCRNWTVNLYGGREGQNTFYGEGRTPAQAITAAALRTKGTQDEG